MSQIIKSFMGLFLIVFMVMIIAGLIGTYLTITLAQEFHSQVICQLEDSNFNEQVMAEEFELAENKGYSLKITMYYEDNSQDEYRGADEVQVKNLSVQNAKVELQYNFNVAIFALEDSHVISGYAR